MSADAAVGKGRFPRAARLLAPREFQNVFSLGRRLNGPAFRLHALVSDPAVSANASAPARLGISVPKRVAALAVERNRIRRIARESFRFLRGQLPPGDYVLVAQREAKGAGATVLRDALSALWRRAGALKPEGNAPTMPIPKPGPAEAARDLPPSVAHPEVARPEPASADARRAARGTQDDSDR